MQKRNTSALAVVLAVAAACAAQPSRAVDLADDAAGNVRKSDGYLIQGTYTFGALKLGVNNGVSKLDYANAADQAAVPNLLDSNSKVTGGAYYSLTKNLTSLAEISNVETKAHSGNENKSTDANLGVFFSY